MNTQLARHTEQGEPRVHTLTDCKDFEKEPCLRTCDAVIALNGQKSNGLLTKVPDIVCHLVEQDNNVL